MKTVRFAKKTVALMPLLYLSTHLCAQFAPPSTDVVGEPVILEEFSVNTDRDNGYIAVDSLAGGRSNTPIKFTPSAMSSLTRTFLDDLEITNVRDALKWSPNVVPGDLYAGKQIGNPFNSWDFNFRGAGQSLQGGAGPTRNYFTFYQAADTYNVDRIEFDRGPNSILFGVGSVGGVLSTYTKVPRLDRNFTTVTATVDNNGSRRVELDFNHRLSEALALRFNAVDDHREGWRHNDHNHFMAADLAVLFKPTITTSLRIEFEGGRARNTLISSTYGDGLSKWDGTSASQTWGAAPTNPAGTRQAQAAGFGTNPYNVYIPGLKAQGLMNWNGGYISSGIDPDGIPVAPYAGFYPATFHPLYPWMNGGQDYDTSRIPVLSSRRFTYGNGISRPEYHDLTAYLDQKFGRDVDVELSFYRYGDRHNARDYEGANTASVDVNKQLPDGTVNPNFGQTFADFFLSMQQQNREVTEARAQLNYRIEAQPLSIPLQHIFSVSLGDQNIKWHARQYLAQDLTSTATDPAQRMIWGRLYFDHPNEPMNIPSSIGGKTIGYGQWPTYWFDFDETYKLKNIAAVSQTRLWNDRLSIVLGARRDTYEHNRQELQSGRAVDDSASGDTYSAGAIYYFGWLGVFGNYSKNFDPIGPGKLPGLSGLPFGPSTGQGSDFGIRISTKNGRYYASLSRYDTKSRDRIFNGGKPDFAGLWRKYYDALGQPRDPLLSNLAYDDTEALKASGYELDFTANPTSNLRMSVTYGKPDSKIVEALPGARSYFAANLPAWTSAAGGTSVASQDLRSQITSTQNTLDQNVAGRTKIGLVDYTASIFANYSFGHETLNGFSVGGGVAFTGKQYVGQFGAPDGQPKFPYYGSAQRSTTLVLAYQTKISSYPVRFALNVDNVLDQKDPIITGYHFGWVDAAGHNIPNGYILPAPRTFRLTARVTF